MRRTWAGLACGAKVSVDIMARGGRSNGNSFNSITEGREVGLEEDADGPFVRDDVGD